jgi:transcriptional regulator with XRE-family HTH domain
MNWTKIISEIVDAGITQAQIAERCGISQPYVSDLMAGKSANPGYALGVALEELHKKRHRKTLTLAKRKKIA